MVDSVRAEPRSIPAGGEPARTASRWRPRRKHNSYWAAPLLMISINLVLFLLFFLWPAVIGLKYSFTSYTGVGPAPWVGTDNYQRLLHDPAFWAALKRTLIYTACVVPLIFVASLGTAYLMVSPYSRGKTVARVIFFLPWLISPIIAGVIWRWIFGENFGLVNFIITELGGKAVDWQTDANLSLIIVIIAATWMNTAFNMLLFIAALKNVPTAYYEAADLDGANAWQKFRRITLPAIAPTSFIVVLLSTLGSMKEYGLVVAVNAGGPGTDNNLIVQYIYTTGFRRNQIGYASAASFVLMLILVIIAVVQLLANRRKGS
ncbi:carbohydrate ABC transporter permease [Actinoplanes subtropicus]|uniref:carbohydrate ABC transporter permease n=1 Tax=Actinoplanes subtropicus TaxID=543632 RepID=UPI0009FE1794|nr:sugar ABC transporter permease [Actinoplanes subtropicus]